MSYLLSRACHFCLPFKMTQKYLHIVALFHHHLHKLTALQNSNFLLVWISFFTQIIVLLDNKEPVPSEFIIVVDRSGSMSGLKMDLAN